MLFALPHLCVSVPLRFHGLRFVFCDSAILRSRDFTVSYPAIRDHNVWITVREIRFSAIVYENGLIIPRAVYGGCAPTASSILQLRHRFMRIVRVAIGYTAQVRAKHNFVTHAHCVRCSRVYISVSLFLPFLHAYHCTYRCDLRTLYTLRITIFSMRRARSRQEASEKDRAACGISCTMRTGRCPQITQSRHTASSYAVCVYRRRIRRMPR